MRWLAIKKVNVFILLTCTAGYRARTLTVPVRQPDRKRRCEMDKRNGRIAGLTFLLYYATALGDMFLFAHASSGKGTAEKLASIAHNAAQVELAIVLSLLTVVYALILAVTLYALTAT